MLLSQKTPFICFCVAFRDGSLIKLLNETNETNAETDQSDETEKLVLHSKNELNLTILWMIGSHVIIIF